MRNYAMAQALRPGSASPLTEKKEIPTLGLIPIVLGTALGAGTAWVGFRTGVREPGAMGILGYIVGGAGALSALVGATTLVLLAMTSASEVPAAPPREPSSPGEYV